MFNNVLIFGMFLVKVLWSLLGDGASLFYLRFSKWEWKSLAGGSSSAGPAIKTYSLKELIVISIFIRRLIPRNEATKPGV